MKITVRGWGRDMGTKIIADHELKCLSISRDISRTVRRGDPGIFTSFGKVFVSWFQNLRLTGDYRMEIELSNDDILRLFKSKFGSELNEWLLEEEGFTVSPELTKRILRTVKLSDVTLGDLAAMNDATSNGSATAEKLLKTAKVTPLLRRV